MKRLKHRTGVSQPALPTNAANKDCASRLVVDVADRVCGLTEDHGFNAKAVNNSNARSDLPVHQCL
jgi:hypothetical protein